MKKRKICQVAMIMIGIMVICHLIDKEEKNFEEIFGKAGTRIRVQGTVYDKEVTADRVTLFLKYLSVYEKNQMETEQGRIIIYLKKENLVPEIGTQVLVEGIVKTIQEPTNPGNFNQKTYYQKQKIVCMLQEADLLKKTESKSVIKEEIWKIRTSLSEKIVSKIGTRYGGILCTMLFCEDSYEEDELKELYQKSGLGHLLAVSSLHMTFWGMGLYRILKRFHIHKYVAVVTSVIGLTFYFVFIGGGVSALRAFLMFTIQMVGILLGREYDGLTALACSAIVQLVVQPLYLFDAAFLLSYAAVLGIYLVGAPMKEKIDEKFRVSLAVQITILPILLYFYYEICIYSFFWNLIAVPLSGLVMSLGAGGIIFPPLWILAKGVLWFWENGSRVVLHLPFSRWVIGVPDLWQIVAYYGFLVISLCLLKKKKVHLKGFFTLVCICVLMLILPQKLDKNLEVTMLDVGQGDSIFVQSPSGETFLVDGGSSSVNLVGRYRIESFFKYRGVGTLDYVFLSHGDEDHISGIRELLERQFLGVKIGALVLPPQRVWEENLYEIARLAQEKKVPIYCMEQGDELSMGEVRLGCLWPDKTQEDSGNESSMVLSMTCGEFAMLFTGDLELSAEKNVCEYMSRLQKMGEIPDSYEVLKVGHHGSSGGTSEELLKIVRPKWALISCGENNRYGHPHKETLERLETAGCDWIMTASRGAIEVQIQ